MIHKLTLILTACFLIGLSVNAANLENGKVYMFHNQGHPENSLSLSGASMAAVGAKTNSADFKQLWYAEADAANSGFYLRNALNGAYLESPSATYTQWPVVFTSSPNANMVMVIDQVDGNICLKKASASGRYIYAHNDGSNNIVCWESPSISSQWTLEEIPMTAAQISDMKSRFQSTGDEIAKTSLYQSYLDNLFSDKACTELKSGGDLSSNSSYAALPPALKNMVDKVNSGVWTETSSKGEWAHKYAYKYRVQEYEPFSEGSAASSMAGIQAYTNMNNPTGIIANQGDLIYIMVDQEPLPGSTLYIGAVPDCSMYNSVTAGTQLHQGLNIILCNSNLTHYFIYYTVNTAKDKKPVKGNELSKHSPIKIHIEGGQVNGFFNHIGDKLYTADTKEDFEYTTARAQHPMYDLVGKYVILHFFLEDTPDLPGQTPQLGVKSAFNKTLNHNAKHDDPVETLQAWDNMCFAERILMGIQSDDDIRDPFNQNMYESIVNDPDAPQGYNASPDFQYSDYFNNRMMGITLQAQGLYMNATAWRTAYAPSTMGAILSQFPEDGIWGPAHEYGHMNQTPMRIAGTTEESNNVFSNVANYFVCKTTSRCDYPSEQLRHFSAGDTYLDNGTWGTTRMFWQLWLYYHAAGNNKKFYPRLYELLRNYPLKREIVDGKLRPKSDLLHFAKMCCVAAQEDLTNFFVSWGFFAPQDNYHIDDYDVYDCILTPEDIAQVKAEIKAMELPKNDAIILIDDRPGSTLPTGFGYDKSLCGEYGGLNDFKNGAKATGDFTFTVDGTKVSVSGGDPGAGFLIYDNDGNLIGFSNSSSFTLSPAAAQALVDGEATVKAVGSDNSVVEAVDPVRKGSINEKKNLLTSLIQRCDDLLAKADATECRVGDFFVKSCEPLKALRDAKNDFLASAGEDDSDNLTQAYLELSKAYYDLLNDPSARIPIVEGAAYRMINHSYTDRSLDAGTDKCVASIVNPQSTSVAFSQQWILQPVEGVADSYYIKNLGDGRYIGTTKKQSTSIPLVETPQAYSLVTIQPGVYSFAPDGEMRFGIHVDASRNVVQWNTTSLPTQWTLVKTSTPEIIALREEVAAKLQNARQTLEACGLSERKEPVDYVFPEANLSTNAECRGGGADKFTSWKVLFDNNVDTYFHSNYLSDSDDHNDHYIMFKAPDNSSFRFFDLSYTTRNIDNIGTNPRSFIIEASSNGQDWREIFHTSGLPTGKAVKYSTGEIIAPDNTGYIKMIVTGSGGSAYGHPYFVLSELSVKDLGEPVFTPDENFPYLKSEDMAALYDSIIDASLDLADSSSSLETLKSRSESVDQALSVVSAVMIPKVEVNSVSFAVDPVIAQVGNQNVKVTVDVDPSDATFPEFEWNIAESEIAEIASVDGKSIEVAPLSMGQTSISVNVVGNPLASATAVLKVLPEVPVEALAIVPGELSIPLNATQLTLSYEVYPENATVKSVVWASSDTSIVEIDAESGEMTLQRPGVCEILATTIDGTDISARCNLTVSNSVARGLILYPESLTLQQGEEYSMSVVYVPAEADQPMVTWESSNSAVVSVDPSGRILALSTGEAIITVKAEVNGEELEDTAVINVVPVAVKGLSLSDLAITLDKGDSADVKAIFTPANAKAFLEWSVSNPEIISFDENEDGDAVTVTALNPGMVTLTANLPDNDLIQASCNITVPELTVEEIQFTDIEDSYDVNDGAKTISVKTLPEDAPTPRLIWEIDDENIASLTPVAPLECEIMPLNEGEATVSVSHADRPEIRTEKLLTITSSSSLASLFKDKTAKIDVFDTKGQVLFKNVDLNEVKDLAPGIYIIRQGNVTKEVLIR